jgi:hypothetical protein
MGQDTKVIRMPTDTARHCLPAGLKLNIAEVDRAWRCAAEGMPHRGVA